MKLSTKTSNNCDTIIINIINIMLKNLLFRALNRTEASSEDSQLSIADMPLASKSVEAMNNWISVLDTDLFQHLSVFFS